MVFTVIISLQINHTSLPFGLNLGVAGKLYSILFFCVWLSEFFTLLIFFSLLPILDIRFTEFGGPIYQRPVQDLAFAVARFIQKGGSYINYYMVGVLQWFISHLTEHNTKYTHSYGLNDKWYSTMEELILEDQLEGHSLPQAMTMMLQLMNMVR